MIAESVTAPAGLLLHRQLLSSAKLVWLVCQLHRARLTTAALHAHAGLSRPTIIKAVAQLDATGWELTAPPEAEATIPIALLLDRQISALARLMYGILQLTPGFTHPEGQYTVATLHELTGVSPTALKQAIAELAQAGWLETKQKSRVQRIEYTLLNPAQAEAINAELRLTEADFRGEEIMREYLTLLIDSSNCNDRVRQGFLKNPITDELMHFDRFYPPGVAFEFHGPQHFEPTKRYSARQFSIQRCRDLMKAGICMEEKITLIVITGRDLKLQTLRAKIGNLLPLRDITGHEPLVNFLEKVSSIYRRSAGKPFKTDGRQRKNKGQHP